MIAAAAEQFATVEERFRYRYPFDESYKNLAVVVVESEEGQVTMSCDVQGSFSVTVAKKTLETE